MATLAVARGGAQSHDGTRTVFQRYRRVAHAAALAANPTLTWPTFASNRIPKAGIAAIEAAIASNPLVMVPFTAAQRFAFLSGHLRRASQQSPIKRLPLDVVRRILTRHTVAQGRREWTQWEMRTCCPYS
jgi:hypothetical protein